MRFMQNDVVVITGAAGALGTATARAFLAKGARLALVDRADDALRAACADLPADSVLLLGGVDVTSAPALAAMAAAVIARFEHVDVLVNIAGAYRHGSVMEMDEASWAFLMDLNAKSVYLAARAVVPELRKRGGGRIVSIGSPAALTAFAGGGVYAASKAAVLRLTEALSAELKGEGIRVNAVLPGTMDTPANRSAMPDADPTRWVTTAEVADVVVFLASEGARGIHGASVPVLGRS